MAAILFWERDAGEERGSYCLPDASLDAATGRSVISRVGMCDTPSGPRVNIDWRRDPE